MINEERANAPQQDAVEPGVIRQARPFSSRRFRIVTLIWYGWILVGSLLPGWKARIHSHSRHHGVLHFCAYALAEVLTLVSDPWQRRPIISSLIVIGLAFLTEGLQKWRYVIPFEWHDILADTAGVVAAAIIFFGGFRLKRYLDAARRPDPNL